MLGVVEPRLDLRRIACLHGAETSAAIEGLVHELLECLLLLLLGVAGVIVRGTGLAQGGTGGLSRSGRGRGGLVLLGHGGGSVKLEEGHVGVYVCVGSGDGCGWFGLLCCCVFDVWN